MKTIKAVRQAFWVITYYGFLLLFVIGIWAVNIVSLVISPFLSQERTQAFLRGFLHSLVNVYVTLMHASGSLKTNRNQLWSLGERPGGGLIIANHPSMLDAPVFLSRIPGVVCVFKSALKQSLLLPGTAKNLGYLSNDEGMDMLREMDRSLKNGDKILVFPEGTRTSEKLMNPLNKGYALAAQRANVPVQLMAVRTDTDVLSKRQSFFKATVFPVHFHFEIGPVIEPGEFRSVNELNKFAEWWFRETLASGSPLPKRFLPASTQTQVSDSGIAAEFVVPGNVFYCRGHMPGNPIVPAYAQMAWIRELVAIKPMTNPVLAYRRLKFLKPIQPGDAVEAKILNQENGGRVELSVSGTIVTRGTVGRVEGDSGDE